MVSQIERFQILHKAIQDKYLEKIENMGPYIFLLHSAKPDIRKNEKTKILRDIDLCLLAGVHGNEVGGVQVLIGGCITSNASKYFNKYKRLNLTLSSATIWYITLFSALINTSGRDNEKDLSRMLLT